MVQQTRIILSLLALLGLYDLTVNAKPLHSSMRVRFNPELVRSIFNKKDQMALNALENMTLGYLELSNGLLLQDVKVSILPESVSFDEYNFITNFDESDFVGIEGKDLKFQGVGYIHHKDGETVNKEEVQLSGPIDKLRVSFELYDNGTTKASRCKGYDFELESSKIQVTVAGESKSLDGEGVIDQIRNWAREELINQIKLIVDDFRSGSLSYLQKMPVLNMTPLVGLFHLTSTAENVQLSNEFLEYGFSPKSLKLLKESNDDLLNEIQTEFEVMNDQDQDKFRAFQVLIDENFPNAAFTKIVASDRKFSLRELLSSEPRFAIFSQLLTTSTVGMVLPSFKEEFGSHKPVDIVATVNHESIKEISDSFPLSGFTLDQKGNFKVSLNIAANIIVEKKTGKWVDTRSAVLTIALKGKIFTADDEFENRTLVVMPRGIELNNLKIFKGDEEQFLEQTLAQSLIGVQLEQFKKQLKPQMFPLRNFTNPPELQCLGFNLTNVDVKVNKGYMQISCNYKNINFEDLSEHRKEMCSAFEFTLRQSPEQFGEIMSKYVPGLSHLKKASEGNLNFDGIRAAKPEESPAYNQNKQKGDQKVKNRKSILEGLPENINIPDHIAEELANDEAKGKKKRQASSTDDL